MSGRRPTAAKAARGLTNDPARPLQTLALNSILAAPLHERFNRMELNAIAGYGIATQEMGSEGVPMILRETTTYQLNLYGQGDDAYELVTTLATLARLLRNQKQAITSKFPRHKLANDGTRFGPGQAIVTPGIIKAELVAEYRQDEYNGLVEDTKSFKNNLLVERDPNNPNRVNVLYPPDLINQLRVFAVLAQFRLQYDRGVDQRDHRWWLPASLPVALASSPQPCVWAFCRRRSFPFPQKFRSEQWPRDLLVSPISMSAATCSRCAATSPSRRRRSSAP